MISSSKKIRTIAFHLPQFYPTPENDQWWGKGFTEWTNVTKAKPLFKNHYQPHLPADMGFYDLRLKQSRLDQANMANEYGIDGFCYYHYWFNGKRLLNEPVDRIVKEKEPNFPFMLCWANENWTRRWDGLDQEVLIEQQYAEADDENHIKWLCENRFNDERYIKVNGAPVFSIYKAGLLPNLNETINTWKKIVKSYGFPDLYLMGVNSSGSGYVDLQKMDFNAILEFQPDWTYLQKTDFWSLVKYKFNLGVGKSIIFDYQDLVNRMLARPKPTQKQYPCVTPNWDNSARKKKFAFITKNSTPQKFYKWFKEVLTSFKPFSEEENFVFINAWNEWAEGNHLEPDQKWGKSYLEATKKALDEHFT